GRVVVSVAERTKPLTFCCGGLGLRISRYCPECGSPDVFVVAWPGARCLRCDCSYELNESDLYPANPLPIDQRQIRSGELAQIDRWQMMAEEIRAYADITRNSDAGDTLRKIAQQYDQLAENAVRRLNS